MDFDKETENKVWNKGKIVRGNDPAKWRKDACNAWIHRESYGDRDEIFGWEIDHIEPNGNNHISNLQPLHWENNAAKGEGKLKCAITSKGTSNVYL